MARIERNKETEQLIEKVVFVNRVSKVVKGGKRFHFSAMVVVGDGNGRAGHAIGKAKEVSVSIRKGIDAAKKAMVPVPIEGETIPHTIIGRFGAGKVLLKPAAQGTGIIAGNAVRAVMEAAGIHNVVSKCLGSDNYHNVIRATFNAFQSIETLESVEAKRGLELTHLRKAKKGE